ncbi:MAG: phage portal protein, partial [Alistipes sp.]
MRNKKLKTVTVGNRCEDPYPRTGGRLQEDDRFWRWGDDNLFPEALALLSRRSTIHRRIINDKADYGSGKGLVCDEAQSVLRELIARANGGG